MRYRTNPGVGSRSEARQPDAEPVFPLQQKARLTRPASFFPRPSRDAPTQVWASPDSDGIRDANQWPGTPPANEWPADAWPVDNDPGSGIRPIPREPSSPPAYRGDVFRRDSFKHRMIGREIIQEEIPENYDMAHYDLDVAEYDALDTDDLNESLVPRRMTAREILGRVFGGMVFVGALYGCFTVLANPHARHEALNWVTLGHADQVAGVAHEARTRLRDLVR